MRQAGGCGSAAVPAELPGSNPARYTSPLSACILRHPPKVQGPQASRSLCRAAGVGLFPKPTRGFPGRLQLTRKLCIGQRSMPHLRRCCLSSPSAAAVARHLHFPLRSGLTPTANSPTQSSALTNQLLGAWCPAAKPAPQASPLRRMRAARVVTAAAVVALLAAVAMASAGMLLGGQQQSLDVRHSWSGSSQWRVGCYC